MKTPKKGPREYHNIITGTFEAKRTPLYDDHLKLNARMAPFGGWMMPIQFDSILEEHGRTRLGASVFDTCHMGEFSFKGDPERDGLENALTVNLGKMRVGCCRYGFMLNERGGVIDDLVAYRISEDEWMIVVNAGDIPGDFAYLRDSLAGGARLEDRSNMTGKLDVQGPLSAEVMRELTGSEAIAGLRFYTFDYFELLGERAVISRTGYTGELGFEIYMRADKVAECYRKLLEGGKARPAGLGARDILRLEMGFSLYGQELDRDTTPIEARLGRFLDFEKDFTGKSALYEQKSEGAKKILAGLISGSRKSPRRGNSILAAGRNVGRITSGGFSPSLEKGIGLAYMEPESCRPGESVAVSGDKGSLEARVVELPFYAGGTARQI